MELFLELVGYVGTALVLISMLMTSVVKLRIFNAVGSFVSMVYAYFSGTWPVVILNLSLLVINTVQLIRLSRAKVVFEYMAVPASDRSLQHFLAYYRQDIGAFFPGFTGLEGCDRIYMICRETEPVGILAGSEAEGELCVALDYTTPKYRDCSVGSFLFASIGNEGIKRVVASSENKAHLRYLKKIGFVRQDGAMVKVLTDG